MTLCVLSEVSEDGVGLRDDSLLLDPQGMDLEQVYCSVPQLWQDTLCQWCLPFITPLPLTMSLLMSLFCSPSFQPTFYPLVSLMLFSPFLPSFHFPSTPPPSLMPNLSCIFICISYQCTTNHQVSFELSSPTLLSLYFYLFIFTFVTMNKAVN